MPAWTYLDVKEADAALDPPLPDPGAAADELNKQTVTLTNQPFAWKTAKRVAREAPTGDWSRIVARARQTPALPPATLADQAILAAINAVESADGDMIDPNDPLSWQAFQNGLAALASIGDLAPGTVAALNALSTVTVPRWQPRLDAGHVQTGRAQP